MRVATNQAAATSNQVAGAPVVTTNGVSTNLASLTNLTRPLGSAGLEKFQVRTEVPEQLLVLTNLKARYTFTSYGGGLKLIELPGYPGNRQCPPQENPAHQRCCHLELRDRSHAGAVCLVG